MSVVEHLKEPSQEMETAEENDEERQMVSILEVGGRGGGH